jgi:AhpD family alkylhydroperoxidase
MPRLRKLESHEGEPKSQELMRRLEKNKNLLNIFRSMANSPACLDAYLKFAMALREGKLDARTRQAISLVVSQVNGCEYGLSAHTLLAKDAGLDEQAIRAVRQGKASSRKLNGAVALAKKVAELRGAVSDADVRAARAAGLDDAMIAEVVANVALNAFTTYFNQLNQTEIDLPHVSSRLEERNARDAANAAAAVEATQVSAKG